MGVAANWISASNGRIAEILLFLSLGYVKVWCLTNLSLDTRTSLGFRGEAATSKK